MTKSHKDSSEKKEQSDEVPSVESTSVQELLKESYENAIRELNEFKDKYFRAIAENENMRKRLQREKLESQTLAIQSVVIDFLQPLDHFEQALKHTQNASDEVKHWALGFQMILQQFKQVLNDNGVHEFDSLGAQFDPHCHEAIEIERDPKYQEGTVIEEFVRGYKMGSRLLRPAKVKVAASPSATVENEVNIDPIDTSRIQDEDAQDSSMF